MVPLTELKSLTGLIHDPSTKDLQMYTRKLTKPKPTQTGLWSKKKSLAIQDTPCFRKTDTAGPRILRELAAVSV